MEPNSGEAVVSIYNEKYAAEYPALYITPWPRKHRLNRTNLERIFSTLPENPVWLDLACGQGWHFAQFPGRGTKIGIDLSPAQLRRASESSPDARFLLGDISRVELEPNSVDLVTNFWAGYCYLGSADRIEETLRKVLDALRVGGALYMEVLLPQDLASFNESRFSSGTGFLVKELTDEGGWLYEDRGGCHRMMSPPLAFFVDLLSKEFANLEAVHDGNFMVHLIGTSRV